MTAATGRIASGIKGLDSLLGGGFPEGHMILVAGACGSGKTIFGLQFLANARDAGIFVSFEEDPERLQETASHFVWGKTEKKPRILRYDPYKFEDVMEILENNIREISAKRVVIDSISALGVYLHDATELRRVMLQVKNIAQKNGCTSLLTSEVTSPNSLSRFGVEEFVCDSVVVLGREHEKDYKRVLSIVKVRGSEHSDAARRFDITKAGIVLM